MSAGWDDQPEAPYHLAEARNLRSELELARCDCSRLDVVKDWQPRYGPPPEWMHLVVQGWPPLEQYLEDCGLPDDGGWP